METKELMEKIKDDAISSQSCAKNLISQAVSTLPLVVAGQLPNMSLISRTICRVRSKAQVCPQNPLTIDDLNIPNEYKFINNKQFLLHDNHKENRILIFSQLII